jgi:5-methyltetrahydrofolate--homocysteine methyltransferase
MDNTLASIRTAVMEGNAGEVESQVKIALEEGKTPKTILDEALIDGMTEVGQRFERGEYFVPEMLVSARAMKVGLAILRPMLIEESVEPVGRVVIGTVRGDMHDIGKNLVGMMMEGAGFEVNDLGVNVSAEQFVQAAIEGRANIIALSALLTTTMPNMSEVIVKLEESGERTKIKVLVGGAPVTESFAQRIGADGFAPDASQAATLARSFVVA